MVVFLYSLVNGMVSFLLPVFLEETVSSLTIVGLILASSSVWNITTDFILGLTRLNPSYRRLTQLVGMLLFTLFALIALHLHVVTLIIATTLWGIYTELFTFASFDFVVKTSSEADRAGHFGLINNFRSMGFSLAPIMIGLALVESKDLAIFTGLFFSTCMLVLFWLQLKQNKLPKPQIAKIRRRTLSEHIRIWTAISKKMSSYLWVYFVRGVADGVLTSFVPIFVEVTRELKLYGGFIVAGLSLPTAFVSGYFGSLADRLGRQRFIIIGLLLSAVALFFFGFITNPLVAIAVSFIVGVGYSLYVPALEAEMGKYVEKHHSQETEAEGESGMIYNGGFIIGAGLTGILVTILGGYGPAFAILGVLYGVVGVGFWVRR